MRQKAKEILDLIGDDERLRDERRKSRKLKDKFVGISGGGGGGYSDYGGGYSGGGGRSRFEDIGEFDTTRNRRMNPAEQAIDKVTNTVKELWNKRRSYDVGGPGGYDGSVVQVGQVECLVLTSPLYVSSVYIYAYTYTVSLSVSLINSLPLY